MSMRMTFSSPELQKEFERNGYVIVDAISAAEIGALKEGYRNLPEPAPTAFESTMNNRSSRHKELVHEMVAPLAEKTAAAYLDNYKPVIGNFVVKQPSPESTMPPHQDWNMTDEKLFAAVNIWFALDDVNEENGAIYILKQGQKLPFSIRGNFIPAAFDSQLFDNYKNLTPVFMKAGQALIYDLRCIHMSPPNLSTKARFAAGCACAPAEAQTLHYFYNRDEGRLEVYEADKNFYFHYSYGHNKIPEGSKIAWTDEAFQPSVFPLPVQHELLMLQDTPVKRIFTDPGHQQRYERDGYVLLDFLPPAETQSLLDTFKKETGWFEDGFMSSVYAQKDGYRQRADELLQPVGERFVKQFMPGYDVIIGTFMVKGKGEQSAMYPHQDWTLVDERTDASFNLWIPLVDVDHRNGAMSIMTGAHRLPLTMRGSNVPDALADKTQFMPDKLTYMPMKAGQALVYDHRCVHVSPPNTSGQVRPACAIGLVPKGVQAFHFFYDQPSGKLRRYKADKQFYFHHVATQFTAPEKAELIDETDAGTFYTFTPADLAPVFALQAPRKKGFWEKLLKK